ncbi:hypothetical protein, partial [Cupriavidus sp. 8B]
MAAPDELSAPQPTTWEEMLAVLDGEDLEQARKDIAQRAAISSESEQYLGLPAEQWPQINFKWDERPESQRLAYRFLPDRRGSLRIGFGFGRTFLGQQIFQ